ncbi:CRISPR-associated helicase/endonuclease Cas3 [Quadrisphaera sp. DSM 44207]|uniref:CRISPR-associated helicase/endonuclease Cas3 n=1 Tax=Quadrisphaera sp. DSM 44207 TaxID=1881057 RepID=UPI00088BB15D|nr:CRISPR-associated helicase/endonuclease Cas3 [Quadrisphaera sp. DSM 44207]SDQ03927.1 CRISPR-associated helicase, Cas3 family [Quadrisphaera sp. DSM 44207]
MPIRKHRPPPPSGAAGAAATFVPGLVWGKQRGLAGGRVYPLEAHLLDVAAAAGLMIDEVLTSSQREVLARTGLTAAEVRGLVQVVAAWHDVGKAVPAFQALSASAFTALTGQAPGPVLPHYLVGHASAGFAHLVGRFVADGLLARAPQVGWRLGQVVGGHHGVFPRPEAMTSDGLGSGTWEPRLEGWHEDQVGRWRATREALLERVETVLLGRRWMGADLARMPVEVASLLTGVVITADWLMSQVDVIQAALAMLPLNPADLGRAELARHYAAAEGRARRALTDSGLAGPRLRRRPFTTHFSGFIPRGPQVTAAEVLPGLVRGPGIFVVMAPTGDGKTEAALHAAAVLGEASGASGVHLALPTMATTDAMYLRTREFIASAFEEPTRLSLMHSLASLNEEYVATTRPTQAPDSAVGAQDEFAMLDDCDSAASSDGVAGTGHGSDHSGGRVEVTTWMSGAKRAGLAPNAVGTIDQLLAMGLRGKWQPLRLLGVSRKVVIVDEAHSYDAYMQALLHRVLAWLGAAGVPVVLLSATLSGRLARSLVDAYADGAGIRLDPDRTVPSYPGWMYFDITRQVASSGSIPVTDRSTTVSVAVGRYPVDQRGNVDGLVEAVVARVGPVARGKADGNILVVCNTVAAAVAVYDALTEVVQEVAPESGTPVRLMHSRFPVKDRVRHAAEVNRLYGKHSRTTPCCGAAPRPVRSILVATQVVEQSLDLDMDAVVTDLAPMAMLLQRAGRCHRHAVYAPTPDAAFIPVTRPVKYESPSLTVFAGIDADGQNLADRDCAPYDQILLTRSYQVLTKHLAAHRAGVRIPEDVQELIDAVYDADFATDLDILAEQDRQASSSASTREQQMRAAAHIAMVPHPRAVQDLAEMTSPEDADTALGLFTARYEMETVTVLPIWSTGSTWWLDQACNVALPTAGDAARGRFAPEQVRTVVEHTITVPSTGGWVGRVAAWQEALRPTAWASDQRLRDVLVVPFTTDPETSGSRAAVHDRMTFHLHHDRGLTMHYSPPGAP